jgi:hypothetical protein
VPLTGAQATASAGTVNPYVGASKNLDLAGSNIYARRWLILNDASAVTVALTGAQAAASAGTVVAVHEVAVTGAQASAAAGTPVADVTVQLTGAQASAFAGTVTVATGVEVALTGAQAGASAGTPVSDVSVAITGASASAFAGTVTAESVFVSLSFYHPLDNTGGLTGGSSVAIGSCQTLSSGFPGTDVYPVAGTAYLTTGNSGGTAKLQVRAEVAAVVTAKAGMTLIIEKV